MLAKKWQERPECTVIDMRYQDAIYCIQVPTENAENLNYFVLKIKFQFFISITGPCGHFFSQNFYIIRLLKTTHPI